MLIELTLWSGCAALWKRAIGGSSAPAVPRRAAAAPPAEPQVRPAPAPRFSVVRLAQDLKAGAKLNQCLRAGQPVAGTEETFAHPVHQGPVTSLLPLDAETLVSGGGDRVIAVTRVPVRTGAAPLVQRLERSLRCTGLRIDGLFPEPQRQLLARMIARAGSGPSLH